MKKVKSKENKEDKYQIKSDNKSKAFNNNKFYMRLYSSLKAGQS